MTECIKIWSMEKEVFNRVSLRICSGSIQKTLVEYKSIESSRLTWHVWARYTPDFRRFQHDLQRFRKKKKNS